MRLPFPKSVRFQSVLLFLLGTTALLGDQTPYTTTPNASSPGSTVPPRYAVIDLDSYFSLAGINNSGAVVGNYVTINSTYGTWVGTGTGAEWESGTLTVLQGGTGDGTYGVASINDAGIIAGTASTSIDFTHANDVDAEDVPSSGLQNVGWAAIWTAKDVPPTNPAPAPFPMTLAGDSTDFWTLNTNAVGVFDDGGVVSTLYLSWVGGLKAYRLGSAPSDLLVIPPGSDSNFELDLNCQARAAAGTHWGGDGYLTYGNWFYVLDGVIYQTGESEPYISGINRSGAAVGSVWDGDAYNAALFTGDVDTIAYLGAGVPASINNAPAYDEAGASIFGPQIVGEDLASSPSSAKALLWEKSTMNGDYSSSYVMKDLNKLISPDGGWTLLAAKGINDGGAIVCQAMSTGSNPEAHGVLLLPAELGVDANRDGTIVLASEARAPQNQGLPVDATSQAKPFRFWVNDDYDTDSGDDNPASHTGSGDTGVDYKHTYIHCKRDLEDWTRLWIYTKGLMDAIKNDQIKVGLKWVSPTGTPKIKLVRAYESDGGTQYVTDTTMANNQITDVPDTIILDKNSKDGVDTTGTFIFPDGFFSTLSDTGANANKTYLLFEAASVGKGQLTIVFLKPDGTEIGEGPGVWLDLQNIKTLYKSSDADQFVQAWDEAQQAIVFVHGWNMTSYGSRTYAEDMFKRLWHRGFKGRFCYFRWNTGAGPWADNAELNGIETALNAYLAQYNESEYTAWHSGQALTTFINGSSSAQPAVPSGYIRNLVAHSMGNVVAGSAFLSGLHVNHYAMLQAAIPSSCYDDSTARQQSPSVRNYPVFGDVTLWANPTPDDDPDSTTQALAYRGRLASYGSNNLVSFYEPNDEATVYAWELNNAKFKPGNNGSNLVYNYIRTAPAGQKLRSVTLTLTDNYLTDPLEAMPYADQSWSKAAGGDAGTGGAISSNINSTTTYGFGNTHSAEFVFDIQQLKAFYNQLLITFTVTPNP